MKLFLKILYFIGLPYFLSAQNSLTLREGVVIDTKNQYVYLQDVNRKVQARSIDSGKPLWVTNQSAKPLTLAEGQLICQSGNSLNSNKLEVVLFKEGEEGFGFTYELPKNVKVNLGQTLNGLFTITSRYEKEQLYFLWQYKHMNSKGILEAEGTKPALQKGAFRIDEGTNRPLPIQIEELPRSFAGRSIIPTKNNQIAKENGFQFLSKDDNHVLVSKKVSDDITFKSYNWSLYRSYDKKKSGEIRNYKSYAPFYITPSNVLIFETGPYSQNINGKIVDTPLHLVAIDLTSGKEVWSTPIYDSMYHGPTPP